MSDHHHAPPARRFRPLARMRPRDPDEPHRAATPLELLFDLCFVVAVAQAGVRLVHAIAEGHLAHGIVGYCFVFFAIWWAWANFTWFASAYDTDDVPYRIATFVQIIGVLVLAAGVPRAFDHSDYSVTVVGYIIMRIALTCQWLRAARNSTGAVRATALRYAAGLVITEIGWVFVALFLPPGVLRWGYILMAAAELSLPSFAERGHRTSWHPRHIAERYGLFTIIVLGESILAATVAVQSAIDEFSAIDELLPITVGGLLIVFSAYWTYFSLPVHEHLSTSARAILWGQGHYFIFGSAAAIGAGLEVSVEFAVHKAHISQTVAAAAVTVPTALFLLATYLIHSRRAKSGRAEHAVLPVSMLLVLASTFCGSWAVLVAGLTMAAGIAVEEVLHSRRWPAFFRA
ncbi:low temperature requirement protein A [Streptomyces sp. NPDC002133]|uniref:low temperature requirement protein A n=1 Tax=Streptomyces sp. NPDC002133 TaxID=3154409 RepID=UPI003323C9C4